MVINNQQGQQRLVVSLLQGFYDLGGFQKQFNKVYISRFFCLVYVAVFGLSYSHISCRFIAFRPLLRVCFSSHPFEKNGLKMFEVKCGSASPRVNKKHGFEATNDGKLH